MSSPWERLPGARGCLRARPWLLPLVSARRAAELATASGSHPRPSPLPRPRLSPALRSLPRPLCLRRPAPSCAPAPPVSALPPAPRFPAERSSCSLSRGGDLGALPAPEHLGRSVRWAWRSLTKRWFLGSGSLAECVKPLSLSRGDPASPRPASSEDRKRVLVVRGNFAAERLAADGASVSNALGRCSCKELLWCQCSRCRKEAKVCASDS